MDHFTLALMTGAVAGALDIILMMALPVVLILTGKDRKAAPVILLNALLLGFLISVAERYLA